jgi:hypothetical protein
MKRITVSNQRSADVTAKGTAKGKAFAVETGRQSGKFRKGEGKS